MRRHKASSIVILSLVLCAAAADELPLIFNGKDLAGWRVPDPNPWWSVVDGVLVGQSDEKMKGNDFYTEKSYGDVIVETEVRFPDGIDSGIFLRKPQLQVQIGVSRSLKKDMTCSIYARGKYVAVAKGVDKLLKLNEWNKIRVEARGSKYKVWLNGQEVVDYEDAGFPDAAPIGLQIHPGLKMKVEYRELRAKELESGQK
jgi:hypothetical protein